MESKRIHLLPVFSLIIRLSSSLGEVWFWRAYSADQIEQPLFKERILAKCLYTRSPKPLCPHRLFSFPFLSRLHAWFPQNHQALAGNAPTISFPSSAHHRPLSDRFEPKKRPSVRRGANHPPQRLDSRRSRAFHLAESTFDNLFKKNLIPPQELSYYLQIRTRSNWKGPRQILPSQNPPTEEKGKFIWNMQKVFLKI